MWYMSRGVFSVPTWDDSMPWGSGLGLSRVLGFGSNGRRVQNNQNTQAEYSRSPAALRPQFKPTGGAYGIYKGM